MSIAQRSQPHVSFVGRGSTEYRRPDGSTFELRDVPRQWSPQPESQPVRVKLAEEPKVTLPLNKRIVKGDHYRIETRHASFDRAKITHVSKAQIMVAYYKSQDHEAWGGETQWPGLKDPKAILMVEPVRVNDIVSLYHLK